MYKYAYICDILHGRLEKYNTYVYMRVHICTQSFTVKFQRYAFNNEFGILWNILA